MKDFCAIELPFHNCFCVFCFLFLFLLFLIVSFQTRAGHSLNLPGGTLDRNMVRMFIDSHRNLTRFCSNMVKDSPALEFQVLPLQKKLNICFQNKYCAATN